MDEATFLAIMAPYSCLAFSSTAESRSLRDAEPQQRVLILLNLLMRTNEAKVSTKPRTDFCGLEPSPSALPHVIRMHVLTCLSFKTKRPASQPSARIPSCSSGICFSGRTVESFYIRPRAAFHLGSFVMAEATVSPCSSAAACAWTNALLRPALQPRF